MRFTMFGPNADRPLTARLSAGHTDPIFPSQAIPTDIHPLPSLERPDPVGHLLDAPKPPAIKDAKERITKMLMDADASPARDTFLREWLDLSARIEAFLADVKEKHLAGLRRQLAELTPLCRASLDRMNALRAEAAGLEGRKHALEERRGKVNLNLNVAINSKPDDETFPTDEEIAEWSARVDKARAAVEREARPWAALQELIEKNALERRAEATRLAELKQQREDVRAELQGRSRKGPFGLQIPGA